ncbi:MAG: hypothetical protein R3E87_16540 [Burkholderiaceae bacterium]
MSATNGRYHAGYEIAQECMPMIRPMAGLPLLAMAALAACGTYVWKHPTKDQAAFHADKLDCEQRALTMYPVTIVQTQAQAGYEKPRSTRCETREGVTTCESTSRSYVPPKIETRDVNANNRARAIDACLGAAGWSRERE